MQIGRAGTADSDALPDRVRISGGGPAIPCRMRRIPDRLRPAVRIADGAARAVRPETLRCGPLSVSAERSDEKKLTELLEDSVFCAYICINKIVKYKY